MDKEILKKIEEDSSLYWGAKCNIMLSVVLIEAIDEYLNGEITVGKIYSVNDFVNCRNLDNFHFIFVDCNDFINIAVFDDIDDIDNGCFSEKFDIKFKDRYIYFKDSDVTVYLDEYISNRDFVNVGKKYLDAMKDAKSHIIDWLSSQLIDVSYIMKCFLKDSNGYCLTEGFVEKIHEFVDDIYWYKSTSFEEYVVKKAKDILAIEDTVESLIYLYFCDCEYDENILKDVLDVEVDVNEIKKKLKSFIIDNKELMDEFFESIIIPQYLFEKYNHDRERLNCIIKFNLMIQEIYDDINVCIRKTGDDWCRLVFDNKEYCGSIDGFKIHNGLYSLKGFLNREDILLLFKYISFLGGVKKLTISELYLFSIYDANNTKIYELTEDKINELISLRNKINLEDGN